MYRFEFGGLQSLLAGCIPRIPGRHVVICLADADPAAAATLGQTELIALDRHRRGTWYAHCQLFAHLRRLRPAVLQTYNIGTIEYAFTAWLAGVPHLIHAEHGRGMVERQGDHRKYNLLRRVLAPLFETFVTVSNDMRCWMLDTVGIPAEKLRVIRNGIDTDHFQPADRATPFVIGTIGRLDTIKAQSDLVDALILLKARGRDVSLIIVGEGPQQPALEEQVRSAGLEHCVALPGAQREIAAILHTFSVFVLPSLSEASPITLLEAMASGIPVVATDVGGVPALLGGDLRGTLVPPSQPSALADAIERYMAKPSMARAHVTAARLFVVDQYSIDTTAAAYAALYFPP